MSGQEFVARAVFEEIQKQLVRKDAQTSWQNLDVEEKRMYVRIADAAVAAYCKPADWMVGAT